jgi:hypothetical protein
MLVFLTQFVVNYCPSNLLSCSSPPHLPPFQSQSTLYSDIVWLGGVGGGEVLSCVGDHFLPEFNPDQIQNLQKLSDHSKQKPREGGGLAASDSCCKPFTGKLYLITTFGIAFYQSNLSAGLPFINKFEAICTRIKIYADFVYLWPLLYCKNLTDIKNEDPF